MYYVKLKALIMKMTTYLFSVMFGLALLTSGYSQTPSERQQILNNYDLNLLKQLEIQLDEEFHLKRQNAINLALENGWATSYEKENGGQGLLVDVQDGYPVYIETFNAGAALTARVNRINTGGTSGLDLNGENMLVGVWDGGLVRLTHQLLENRATHIDGAVTISSHSTHVTGTIIGSGAFQSGNAQGMAPMAEAITYDFNNAPAEAVNAITTYGLLTSNHSYGIPADQSQLWYLGFYDNNARIWDQIIYNAPYYLPVFAAGNARNTNHPNQGDGGFDILTAYANSKNNLVVAATFQVSNYTGPGSVSMSGFSSWGPTDDGRIKPDIAAKGVNTFSSTGNSDSSYANFSGTSMAAPSVTGVVALLQQHYNDLNAQFMLASTVKGLIIHTADEAGTAPGPDYRFGWGLINAERAADVISNNGTTSSIMELTLTEGGTIQFSGKSIPGEPLVASITWTDRQGDVLPGGIEDDDSPRLINDLDLKLIDENLDAHLPWILDHTNFTAPATKGDNFRDNVEKVEILSPSGDYTVRVTHKGNLFNGEQVVSLIISGLEDVVLSTPTSELLSASIFPNPATNELNIRAITQIDAIEIFNLLGQSLGNYSVKSNSTKIDIGHLKAGTYFVNVAIANTNKVYKFVKR